MAFLSLRSPKGGRTIRNWVLWTVRGRKPTLEPLKPEDDLAPQVVEDTYSWHIGYCSKCAEKILMPPSVGAFLYRLLKREYE